MLRAPFRKSICFSYIYIYFSPRDVSFLAEETKTIVLSNSHALWFVYFYASVKSFSTQLELFIYNEDFDTDLLFSGFSQKFSNPWTFDSSSVSLRRNLTVISKFLQWSIVIRLFLNLDGEFLNLQFDCWGWVRPSLDN